MTRRFLKPSIFRVVIKRQEKNGSFGCFEEENDYAKCLFLSKIL
jgi:hypothetical protein